MRGLSVIICTRNRPEDLKKYALNSLLNAQKELGDTDLEVIILDDGNLDPVDLSQIERRFFQQGITFVYMNKSERPGLLLSRIEGVLTARFACLLFIDDDVEIDRYYLIKLMQIYHENPTVVGIGGIDILGKQNRPKWRQLYEIMIGVQSLHPGRLSLSGYCGSKDQWLSRTKPFETEFLHGCNMSFRKNALSHLTPNPYFTGYSVGEDLYLSSFGRSYGKFLIHPDLRVKHYLSSASRDQSEDYYCSFIMNHYELLNIYRAPFYSYLSLLFTAFGLLIPAWVAHVATKILRKESSYENHFRGYKKGAGILSKHLFMHLFKGKQNKKNY